MWQGGQAGGHGHSLARDSDVLDGGGTHGDEEEASWLSGQTNKGVGVGEGKGGSPERLPGVQLGQLAGWWCYSLKCGP